MLSSFAVVLLGAGTALAASPSYTSRAPESTVEPSLSQIEATAATVTPISPVSDVKGVAFDRFFQVWLENTVRLTTHLWQHNLLYSAGC